MDIEPGTPGPDETRGTRILRRIWGGLPALFLLVLIVVAVGMFARVKEEKSRLEAEKLAAYAKSRPPVNVIVLNAVPSTVRDRLNLPAVVEAWESLEILAEVHAKVTEVFVAEGQRVQKGDVIVQLEDSDYLNALSAAQASYDLALKTKERTQRLFDEEIIPRARLDEVIANVDTTKARLSDTELALDRCTVRAPLSGIVNRLDAKEGLLLNVSDPIAQILDLGRVKVSVGIPESDVDAVRRLDVFDITIDALGGRRVKGRRHFLSRSPETFARLYKLELSVPNPGGRILPGMFARVDVVKDVRTGAIAVPLYAVITRRDAKFVFVEHEGKAAMRPVKTGVLEGWMLEITEGLSPGEKVIVVGHRSVDEGQDVNVIRTAHSAGDL